MERSHPFGGGGGDNLWLQVECDYAVEGLSCPQCCCLICVSRVSALVLLRLGEKAAAPLHATAGVVSEKH